MKRIKQRTIQFALPVFFFKEGRMFVAYCPMLDLSTCGETFEEARKNAIEVLDIFFEECVKRGTLEKTLAAMGWQKSTSKPPRWQPPFVIGEDRLTVRVPVLA